MTEPQRTGEGEAMDWPKLVMRGVRWVWVGLGVGLTVLVLATITDSELLVAGAMELGELLVMVTVVLGLLVATDWIFGSTRGEHGKALVRVILAGGAVKVAELLFLVFMFSNFSVPHGRPLRIRGRVVRAEVGAGAAWAVGARPECSDLSPETCAALAALWRRDAQAEHASVPAFSRIGWALAGLGAPPRLLRGAHAAALQEVAHAEGCFALVAGYAGAEEGPQALPELLRGGEATSLIAVAVESLRDGCLLEGLSADVAARGCEGAEDPAVKDVLATIARDEAAHAELAWEILAWCVDRGGEAVRAAVVAALRSLPAAGPVAYGPAEARLVALADPRALVRHGRVPAELWSALYSGRLAATRERAGRMLGDVEIGRGIAA